MTKDSRRLTVQWVDAVQLRLLSGRLLEVENTSCYSKSVSRCTSCIDAKKLRLAWPNLDKQVGWHARNAHECLRGVMLVESDQAAQDFAFRSRQVNVLLRPVLRELIILLLRRRGPRICRQRQ